MKNQKTSSAADNALQRYQLKIETEECTLILALREAEEELRSVDRNCGGETEPAVGDEKEAIATKANFYRQRLRTVRETLRRIRSGSFGVCASCGDRIGEKRLSALPTALYCLECQMAYERDRASLRSNDRYGAAGLDFAG